MATLSESRLPDTAEKQWKAWSPRSTAFDSVWRKVRESNVEAEAKSHETNQRVHARLYGANSPELAERPWLDFDQCGLGTRNHSQAVLESILRIPKQHHPRTIERREREEAARKETNERRVAQETERVEKLKDEFKRQARVRYIDAGGTADDFEKEFPQIWASHLRQKAAVSPTRLNDQEADRARSDRFYLANA